MKKIICLICLLYGLSAQAQTPTEAVGINTENPQGVLHIDGGATASQPSDDVIIDANGRLGAGVTVPAAKVDLSAAVVGGALRIADGTEGVGKILTSDANGAASWTPPISGVWWYAVLYSSATLAQNPSLAPRTFVNYANGLVSPEDQVSLDSANGTITVPYAGIYRIVFNQHYQSNRSGAPPYWAMTALQVNGINRWTPSIWGVSNTWGATPTFAAVLNLKENDVLRLVLLEAETFSANSGTVQFLMVELLQTAQ